MTTTRWKIGLAIALTSISMAIRLSGDKTAPGLAVVAFGVGIVAVSFLLAWGAEVAQLDVSASLATAALALVAVLPEYAVDLYFAFTAGHRPSYGAYAAANMTGSNRLLIGVGWPLVAVLFAVWARRTGRAERSISLRPRRRVEIAFLGLASLYAFVIPLKGSLGLMDAGVFLGLFAAYLFRTSRQESEEPDLSGVSADLAKLPPTARRATVVGFFVFAAVYVALVAKPFADALIDSGRALGMDEFLLVQWVAPLASEAPELLVAGILASRGNDDTALGTLLSSKVNQWTMLVGSLPLAYLAGGGHGSLVLNGRQVEEFLLTAAQALFAVSVLLRLRFRAREAAIIFVTFALQLVLPSTAVRLWLAAGYVVLAVVLFAVEVRQIIPTFRGAFQAVDEDPV